MGGREVGGMANLLSAHRDLGNAGHRAEVAALWGVDSVPAKPGKTAVEMFEAVARGEIKCLWIACTNPAQSMPDQNLVRAALEMAEMVVVQECFAGVDTVAYADVLLPATTWGEKDGTVTNSERRISRQRAFLPLPGVARPDWDIVADVARRMGFAGFDYAGPAAVFAEHAALSGYENNGLRDFDISAHAQIDAAGYAGLAPFQWPQPAGRAAATTRFFGDGRFYTPDGKARLTAPRPAARPVPDMASLRINTGRIRDQWHTMTRTGVAATLSGHVAEPFVEIAPADAARLGIAPASLVEVANPRARVVVRALVTERQRAVSVFVPIHWTDRFASAARIDALVAPDTDPVSGQPESKATTVAVTPFAARWYGFAVVRGATGPLSTDHWARARIVGGERLELAGLDLPADWAEIATTLFGADAALVSIADERGGRLRLAAVRDGAVVGVLFVAPEPVEVARDWIVARFERGPIAASEATALLAGRPAGNVADPGRKVCSCYGIGVNQIRTAVRQGCVTVAAVGEKTSAGTNCGSCRPEIGRVLAEERRALAVAAE